MAPLARLLCLAAILLVVPMVIGQQVQQDVLRRVKRPASFNYGSNQDDGGITSSEELRAARPMTDFGHPPKYEGLVKRLSENREYLNPPINVFMPGNSAQQVLVRQALIKGQSLGRIPDFGSNAKQFLAMGETANKAIDALKKLPHCVVGNCGGTQIMTFGGSHPEKEDYVSDASDNQQNDQVGVAEDELLEDMISKIDLQFNEPAFEKTVLEKPVADSPEIEADAAFYWTQPPMGLEALPIMAPEPPPGPFTDKTDQMCDPNDDDCRKAMEGVFNQVSSEVSRTLSKLDWEMIMGVVLYVLMGLVIVCAAVKLFYCLCEIDWAEIFSGCSAVQPLSEQMGGCAPFDYCDYMKPCEEEADNAPGACDDKCSGLGFLGINFCDMFPVCGDKTSAGGGGRGSQDNAAMHGYMQVRYGGAPEAPMGYPAMTQQQMPYYDEFHGLSGALSTHGSAFRMSDIQEHIHQQSRQQQPNMAPQGSTGHQHAAWSLPNPPDLIAQRTVSADQNVMQQQQQQQQPANVQQQQQGFINQPQQRQGMSQMQADFMQPNRPRHDSNPYSGFYTNRPPNF